MNRIALLLLLPACDGSVARTIHAMGEPPPDVACECPDIEPRETYRVDAYAGADPGQQATAVAACDDGDMVIHGGCTWGKAVGTMDAVSFGPNDAGYAWQCTGVSRVDDAQTAVYAVAICEVSR